MQEVDNRNREGIFSSVQSNDMLDPCILHAEAFKQIADDFSSPIREGPTYICDIYVGNLNIGML